MQRARVLATLLACALLGAGAPSGNDPQAPPLTLADAQRTALANYPALKSAQFDELAVHEGITIAHAAYEPQVYGASVQAFNGPSTRLSAFSELNDPTVIQRTALGVGISQYITDFGRTTYLVQAAEAQVRAQSQLTTKTRDLVLLNVTQSYFEDLRAGALLEVAVQTVSERRTLLTLAKSLQRAGLRSILDVSVAQRDLASAQQALLQAQARQRDQIAILSEALGYETPHAFTLRDVGTLPALPTLAPLLTDALADNPDLGAAQAQSRVAELRAAAVDRSSYPTLTAYGFFGLTPIRAANQPIGQNYAATGVALNVPLFTGGALAAEKRQARDAARSAEIQVQTQKDQLVRDVHLAYDTVQTARGNIALSQQVLQTATEAFRLTQARYRIGLNSIVDLSAAQLNEEQAAIARTNATYDYVVQAAALEFVTGVLAGADLFPGASGP
jgi:outer membrane protein